jgi:DNA-binding beta-propeller fold protein YncE
VSIIDTTTNTVFKTLSVVDHPNAITCGIAGGYTDVWVANGLEGTVRRIYKSS